MVKWIGRICGVIILMCVWQHSAHAYEPDIHDYDRNGDGHVTFEELMDSAGRGSGKMLQKLEPLARKAFNAADRNKDGVLSSEDFDDFREGMQRLRRWLDRLMDSLHRHDDIPSDGEMQQT